MDIGDMQSGGGFVENIECSTGSAPRQFRCQLHPLRFAAGQLGGGLSKPDVTEAHVIQGLQFPGDSGQVFKKAQGCLNGHVQHIGDAAAFVANLQCFTIVSPPPANVAGHINIRQKMHLDPVDAVTGTGLASAAANIKTEPPRFVAARPGIRRSGIKGADQIKDAGIGCGIRSGGSADRRLIDVDDFVEVFKTFDGSAGARVTASAVQFAGQLFKDDSVDQILPDPTPAIRS